MKTKTRPATFKAVAQEANDGIVEMIVSTYDLDSAGERVMPGAFAETLAEWKDSGDPIPFIWSHQHDDPQMHIGYVLEAEERPVEQGAPGGLWVKAQIDIDEPIGAKVFKLLKGRRVTQASFCYDVVDGASVKEGDETIVELRKLKLYEVGPTLIGMNQETELLTVKEARAVSRILREWKAGRILSAKNEELLRSAYAAIGEVLGGLEDVEERAGAHVGLKSALAVHHTPTSEDDWDGPENERRLRPDEEEAYYRQAYAWQDPDGDPTVKSTYKFIHHEVTTDGKIGAANVRACQTGIGVLNGARGGTTIPEGDKRGVWRHLAAHLEDADYEPAPLASSSTNEPGKDEDRNGKSEDPMRREAAALELVEIENALLQA